MVIQERSASGRLHRIVAGLALLDAVQCCWTRDIPPVQAAVIAQSFGDAKTPRWVEVELSSQATQSDVTMIEELLLLFAELYKQAQTAEQLFEHAQTDPLTGLWNRRGFDPVLSQGLGQHQRTGANLAVLAIDIDFFKELNDTHGHDGGDAALTRIARVLKQSCRPGDVVARVGGDEMLVLLHDCDAQGAACVAERMQADLNLGKGSSEPKLSLSIGIADTSCIKAQSAQSPAKQLLKAADQALYQVKQAGKGHFAIYCS